MSEQRKYCIARAVFASARFAWLSFISAISSARQDHWSVRMKRHDYRQSHLSDRTSRKNIPRDAEILALFGDIFRVRGNEMDLLLDLALCVLASTTPFPEKSQLESTLKQVRSLLRTMMGPLLETPVPCRAGSR